MKFRAYHNTMVNSQNPAGSVASCIVESPNGTTERLYQFGDSDMQAALHLSALIRFLYGVEITKERVD